MSKPKQEKEKKEETMEEWVKRINTQDGKRNGLRRRGGRHHR